MSGSVVFPDPHAVLAAVSVWLMHSRIEPSDSSTFIKALSYAEISIQLSAFHQSVISILIQNILQIFL